MLRPTVKNNQGRRRAGGVGRKSTLSGVEIGHLVSWANEFAEFRRTETVQTVRYWRREKFGGAAAGERWGRGQRATATTGRGRRNRTTTLRPLATAAAALPDRTQWDPTRHRCRLYGLLRTMHPSFLDFSLVCMMYDVIFD